MRLCVDGVLIAGVIFSEICNPYLLCAKMPKDNKCRDKGCRKRARVRGFCAKHAIVQQLEVKARAPKRQQLRLRFPTMSLDGFCCRFFVPLELIEVLEKIAEEVDITNPEYNDHRQILDIKADAFVGEALRVLAENACVKSFGKLIVDDTKLVIAPPKSRRKPRFQNGMARLHRDIESTEDSGYLTLLVCLTEVTEDNGAVDLYPNTQRTPLNDKYPQGSIRNVSCVTLTGTKGTCWLFDSRLLHQSKANMTEDTRLTLNCLLHTIHVRAREIIV